MSQNRHFSRLRGSERYQPADARQVGNLKPDDPIRLSVYVKPGRSDTFVPTLHELSQGPYWHLNAEQSAQALAAFEADSSDLEKVVKHAKGHNLRTIEAPNRSARSVRLEGTIGDAIAAFGVELGLWELRGRKYRGRVGAIGLPSSLVNVVEAVFGFDNRPVGRPYIHRNRPGLISRAFGLNTYLPPQVAEFYDFPENTDGSGQIIAIFTFNGSLGETGETALGGYSPELLKTFFGQINQPIPQITNLTIQGPGNVPGPGTDPNDATDEVLLDICVAASVAPKAKFLMYFTEFTEQGWVDAITAAVTAPSNRPNVISISYGNAEDGPAGERLWTRQAIVKVNEALQRAALAGITICVAAGDQGSTEDLNDRRQHVDFPASSPWALGCGGTRVVASLDTIVSETVWNDGPDSATGGGISSLFPVPGYQAGAQVPPSANPGHAVGRGVPDVSGLADPETGVRVAAPDGSVQTVGGTSATAPLWAALIARLNQAVGKPLGFPNPVLYKTSGVLRDITVGSNGAYSARPGWDPCTGLGSPNGTRLLAALQGGGPSAASRTR